MVKREDIPEVFDLNNRLKYFEHGIERLLTRTIDDRVTIKIDFMCSEPGSYTLSTKTVLECLEAEAQKYRAQLEKLGIWFPE